MRQEWNKIVSVHDSSNNKSVRSAGAISEGNLSIKIAAKLFIVARNFQIYMGHSTCPCERAPVYMDMDVDESLSVKMSTRSSICYDNNHHFVSKFINGWHSTGPNLNAISRLLMLLLLDVSVFLVYFFVFITIIIRTGISCKWCNIP